MATTTPNFGWPVPTSTDLVKDGATAIEALGDGVDASLVDLKGGLTGQVLAKATNTDLDFAWVTQDDANAIQNAQLTAKGALITAFSAGSPATLTVGNNGETLVADSSTSTGLRYTAGNPIPNPVLNSAFQIWQRGTSFLNPANGYTADRWLGSTAAAGTVSRQVTGDTTNLPNIQYCLRYQRTAASTSTATLNIAQSFETVNSIPFAGKGVTFSFYARAGANYSPASNALVVQLITGTGTDQNFYTVGYTGSATPINTSVTLTTTWQRFTVTGTIAATATELGVYFQATPVGTAGAADYYEVTGIQLDIGSVALPFRTNGATIQGELAACQRYYFRNTVGGVYGAHGLAYGVTTTTAFGFIHFPTAMRAVPTSIDFSNIAIDFSGVFANAVSAITGSLSGTNLGTGNTYTTTGLTPGIPYDICNNNNVNGYLGYSAEL